MPPELTSWLPVQIVGVLTVAAGIAWFLRTIGIPTWRSVRAFFRRLADFLDDWFGEPARPGVPARPGMGERVQGLEEKMPGMEAALAENAEALAEVRYHVQPNHGGSAHDDLTAKVEQIASTLSALTQAQLAVAGAMDHLREGTARELRELREEKHAAHIEIRDRLARIETHPQTTGEES